jgi:hypothetical protein
LKARIKWFKPYQTFSLLIKISSKHPTPSVNVALLRAYLICEMRILLGKRIVIIGNRGEWNEIVTLIL